MFLCNITTALNIHAGCCLCMFSIGGVFPFLLFYLISMTSKVPIRITKMST